VILLIFSAHAYFLGNSHAQELEIIPDDQRRLWQGEAEIAPAGLIIADPAYMQAFFAQHSCPCTFTAHDHDRYGVVRATIRTDDNSDLHATLLTQGHARLSGQYSDHPDFTTWRMYEDQARRKARGLWRDVIYPYRGCHISQ
ncbi:MAG: thermonuclease family protein, partial [Pseudomonadota bacterium]